MLSSLNYLKDWLGTVLSLHFNRLVGLIVSILITPILIKHLGMNFYGFTMLLISYSQILIISDFGSSNLLINKGSDQKKDKSKKFLNEELAFALIISMVLGLLICLSLIFFHLSAIDTFGLEQVKLVDGIYFVIIIFVLKFIEVISKPAEKLALGFGQLYIFNILHSAGLITSLVLLYLIESFEFAFFIPLIFLGIPFFFRFIAMIILLKKLDGFSVNTIKKPGYRKIINFAIQGSPFALIGILSTLAAFTGDKILISIFFSNEMVAFYSIMEKVYIPLLISASAVSYAFWPFLRQMKFEKNFHQEKLIFFSRTLIFFPIISLLFIFFTYFFWQEILSFMSNGESFNENYESMVTAFSMYILLCVISEFFLSVIYANDGVIKLLKILLIFTFLTLILKIIYLNMIGTFEYFLWVGNFSFLIFYLIPVSILAIKYLKNNRKT